MNGCKQSGVFIDPYFCNIAPPQALVNTAVMAVACVIFPSAADVRPLQMTWSI